jgi:protein-S-isoprenylcysteine O-methyltransferase Ste14
MIDGAWVVWLVIWIALSRSVKQVARRETRAQRAAHIIPMVIAGALLFFSSPSGDTWLEHAVLRRAAWMAPAGLVVVLAGLSFAVWARLVLAGNWSGTVTLKQDHELIQTGPYRYARHPIYTGLLTAILGTAIAIDEVRGPFALLVTAAAFIRKMQTEEAFMRDAFGDRYARYAGRVAALIPCVW